MSTDTVKTHLPESEPKGLPIGVSVDGKVIPPERVLELAEQHFMNEVKDAHGAIGHEWLSMAPAFFTLVYSAGKGAVTVSSEPLVESWASALALKLSAPILYSLYRNQWSAESDFRRVQRLKKNFEKTGDPKVLHALDFQLEGYEDPEPDVQGFDNDDRIQGNVKAEHLSRAANRVTVHKNEVKTVTSKIKDFGKHACHDVGGVLAKPFTFFGDIGHGWLSVGKQSVLLGEHTNLTSGQQVWHAQQKLSYTVHDIKNRSLSDNYMHACQKGWSIKQRAMGVFVDGDDFKYLFQDAANENAQGKLEKKTMVDHEASRLQRAKSKLVSSMSWSGPSFILENGFVVVEGMNGLEYCKQGNWAMGLSHIFSAAMALRPAQVLALSNTHSVNNFTSPRSRSAGRHEFGKPPVSVEPMAPQ